MITINPAGSHRSCNCCGSDVEVVEVMFNNDKTGRGIEVALCVECMNNLVNAVLKRVVKVYTTNELNYCTSDLVYIEERGDSYAYPALRDCIFKGYLCVMDLESAKNLPIDEYNKTWRCWNSWPTDKQREETPWDD